MKKLEEITDKVTFGQICRNGQLECSDAKLLSYVGRYGLMCPGEDAEKIIISPADVVLRLYWHGGVEPGFRPTKDIDYFAVVNPSKGHQFMVLNPYSSDAVRRMICPAPVIKENIKDLRVTFVLDTINEPDDGSKTCYVCHLGKDNVLLEKLDPEELI